MKDWRYKHLHCCSKCRAVRNCVETECIRLGTEQTRSQVATDPSPDESQNCFVLTDQEKQILIDHHNYEAEKAITRLGCRITERYHRDRAKAIRKGMKR